MAAEDGPVGQAGFWSEVSDAVAPRTVALVAGVLAIQVLFIASYVGAFHKPTPHGVPVDVVAPSNLSARLVEQLNSLPGHPLAAATADGAAAAERAVRADQVAGAFVVDPTSRSDTVLVASGGGAALAQAVQQVAAAVDASRHRSVEVEDLVPLQPGDYRGLTGFYLVVGWIVGGYLVAALLGVAAGARPASPRRAIIRLMAIVPYAVLSGLLGAVVVDQFLGALTGHFWALAGVGIMLVYAAAAATLAFQVLAGVMGIGITVLIFVVAGNPSAGGAYQLRLLPGFFRVVSPALPNGAGVDTVRRIAYFAGRGITGPLLVIGAWMVAGAAAAVIAALARDRRSRAQPPAGSSTTEGLASPGL